MVTNNLKKVVDVPVWELMSQAPVSTGAGSATCFSDGASERYIYYMSPSVFYRYDTYTDSYQQLATPLTTPTTVSSIIYSSYGGYCGNVLGASANTLTIPGLEANLLLGNVVKNNDGTTTLVPFKIRITAGTGIGQERSILSAADPVVLEAGEISAVSSTVAITDATKNWQVNQWVGYQVLIEFGAGAKQLRKVLYNDRTTLTFYDANYQQPEPCNNVALISADGGAVSTGSNYRIISSVVTVDAVWTTTPDVTSKFRIISGGVWYTTSSSSNMADMSFYDVLTDTWIGKTGPGSVLPSALSTEAVIEKMTEFGGTFLSGAVASGAARSVVCTTASTVVNGRYDNYQIRVTCTATGVMQTRRIITTQNIDTTNVRLQIERPWDTNPTSAYTYAIYGDTNRIFLSTNGLPTLYNYLIDLDQWSWGPKIDGGLTSNAGITLSDGRAFACAAPQSVATGVVSVAVGAGGTNYVVGNVLTISGGGGNAQVVVDSVSAGGVVVSVRLWKCGSGGYTNTIAATTGGAGSSCTIAITTGDVGLAQCAINTNVKVGDTVTFNGYATAGWNSMAVTVISHNAGTLSTVEFVPTVASPSTASASNANAATLLVDFSKNWTVNEHKGKIVTLTLTGQNPTTSTSAQITSNTANTLTLSTNVTAGTNGTGRYVIYDLALTGRDLQDRRTYHEASGIATGGTTATLVDSTKTWDTNQWAGYKFRVIAGTGYDQGEITIVSNTATTLTFGTLGWSPDTTSSYIINDSFGTVTTGGTTFTDTTKNWPTNYWLNKRVLFIGGGLAVSSSVSTAVASNTANTVTTNVNAATVGGIYCVLSRPTTGAGTSLDWAFGNSKTTTKGKYLISARGGNVTAWDRFDITKDRWEIQIPIMPQSETLTTGSQYTYDGTDAIYFHVNNTGRILLLNIDSLNIDGGVQMSDTHGMPLTGNRMEFLKTADGIRYLYIMKNTGNQLYRVLIF